MKKEMNYRINYVDNTITVTKKFLEAASVLGSTAQKTMESLRELGMKITVRETNSKKQPQKWGYDRMLRYIKHVENSDNYLADFETVRDANSYAKVWAWFKETFPNYNEVPELDDEHRIIVTPANHAKKILTAAA